jgi:hypothetical protein
MDDGLIRELCTHHYNDPLDPIFTFAPEAFEG